MLLAVMPFQYVLAAATQYCNTETRSQRSHFGHHQHLQSSNAGDFQQESLQADGGDQPECGACHLAHAAAMQPMSSPTPEPMPSVVARYREPYYSLMSPSWPERPQKPA